MAKILKCDHCKQNFEIPKEHENAPALQCPFCSQVVQNAQEKATQANEREIIESPLSGEASLQASKKAQAVPAAAPEDGGNLMVEMAKRLAEEQKPNIIIEGLPSENRQVDLEAQKEEEEELTPEEDPVHAAPPYGFGYAPEEEEEEDEEEEDYSSTGNPDASPGMDPYGVVDLPEGTKLPGRGKLYFLLFILLLLVGGYVFIIFAAAANNGIVHFKRIDDTIAIMKGEKEPMELAKDEPKRDTTEGFKPTTTTEEKPTFSVAMSVPVAFELADGNIVNLVYGILTNTSSQVYTNVNFEGVLKTSNGRELSVLQGSTLLSANQAGTLDSAEAIQNHLVAMEGLDDVMTWIRTNKEEAKDRKHPGHTPLPFVLIFTRDVPFEMSSKYLFELRHFQAEIVP